jgi:hypothetical protein
MLASYYINSYMKITKIKVAKWGKPKKYLISFLFINAQGGVRRAWHILAWPKI